MEKWNAWPVTNLCIHNLCVCVCCVFFTVSSEQFPWMSLSQTQHHCLGEQLKADVKLCKGSLVSQRLSGSAHAAVKGWLLQSDTQVTVKVLTLAPTRKWFAFNTIEIQQQVLELKVSTRKSRISLLMTRNKGAFCIKEVISNRNCTYMTSWETLLWVMWSTWTGKAAQGVTLNLWGRRCGAAQGRVKRPSKEDFVPVGHTLSPLAATPPNPETLPGFFVRREFTNLSRWSGSGGAEGRSQRKGKQE